MNKIKNGKQKDIEEKQFCQFAKIYSHIPPGRIIYDDKPDVIIEGKKRLGIELTSFYIEDGALPESEQRQRERREKVVKEAHKAYLKNGGRRIELSFGFKDDNPIRDQQLLIAELSKLAKNIENEKNGTVSRQAYKHIGELDFVYINSGEYSNPRWRIYQVFGSNSISLKRLTKIIRDKEGDSKNYKNCDKLWLLITIDCIDSAQDQELNSDDIDRITSKIFDKVFICRSALKELKEIKCKTV